MRNSSSTDFTPRDGRRFAFPVGVAFLVLSGVLYWRGRETAFVVIATLGGLLLAAGVVIPGRLGPAYRAWMKVAFAIARVTNPIFLGIVYFAVITPTGLIMRILGHRPLAHPIRDGGFWHSRKGGPKGDLRRQF